MDRPTQVPDLNSGNRRQTQWYVLPLVSVSDTEKPVRLNQTIATCPNHSYSSHVISTIGISNTTFCIWC